MAVRIMFEYVIFYTFFTDLQRHGNAEIKQGTDPTHNQNGL